MIVIDPGHGGTQRAGGASPDGLQGATTLEKNVTLQLGRRIAGILGEECVLTREDDVAISHAARIHTGHEAEGGVFVSLHADRSPARTATVWVHAQAGDGCEGLREHVSTALRAIGYEVRTAAAPLATLHPAWQGARASCLVEVGGLGDVDVEAQLLGRVEGDGALADALAKALREAADDEVDRSDIDGFAAGLGTFKGVPELDHFIVSSSIKGTSWARGAATKLTPAAVDSGLVDATDKLILDTSAGSLHTKLNAKLSDPAFDALRKKYRDFGVALIDMTGPRIVKPVLAEVRSTHQIYGASLPKIVALLAAHQLRHDIDTLRRQAPAVSAKDAIKAWRRAGVPRVDLPLVTKILDVPSGSGTVGFTSSFDKILRDVVANNNHQASEAIERLGYRYMASVLVQTGLHEKGRGGLWLSQRFGAKPGPWRSTKSGRSWIGSPVGRARHGATALAAARLFMLMGQGRLVSPADSAALRSLLAGSSTAGSSDWMQGALPACGRWRSGDKLSSKVGLWTSKQGYTYQHQAALVERTTAAGKPLRYAIAILTKLYETDAVPRICSGSSSYGALERIAVEADMLIEAHNP